jgi:hypothetical protein
MICFELRQLNHIHLGAAIFWVAMNKFNLKAFILVLKMTDFDICCWCHIGHERLVIYRFLDIYEW